ncbi:MAG: hypothetical protein P4M14_10400 [Gammaproteobacteria bacterium]|nr:hypothetical protein [Gammaproteobacteria bacterium]
MFGMVGNINIHGNYNGPNATQEIPKHLKLSYCHYLEQLQQIQQKLNAMILSRSEYQQLKDKHRKLKMHFESKMEYLSERPRLVISDKEVKASQSIQKMIPNLDTIFHEIDTFLCSMKNARQAAPPAIHFGVSKDISLIADDLLLSVASYFPQNEYSFLRQINKRMKAAIDDEPLKNAFILYRNLLIICKNMPSELTVSYSLLITTHTNLLKKTNKCLEQPIDPATFEAELLNLAQPKACCAIM